MDINWGLAAGGNNALATFQYGAQLGQQMTARRDQREQQNALLQMRQQEASEHAADRAATLADRQAGAAEKAQTRQRNDLPILDRLLTHATDETTYQQAKAAAERYGIDVSQAPPNFDPAWVQQQHQLVQAVQDPAKRDALSTAGKVAADMGLQPGTPEYTQAVHDIWVAGESKPYTGGRGETRLFIPKVGGVGQAAAPQEPPSEAIAELRQDPAAAAEFDEAFGAGAAARVLGQGGGGPRVTSTFLDGY